jgi:hypothetical protein
MLAFQVKVNYDNKGRDLEKNKDERENEREREGNEK